MELTNFESLWADMNDSLKEYKREATELRDIPGEGRITESVSELHERLVNTRTALDRLESLLAQLGTIRSRVRILVSELQAVYDDAWMNASMNTRVGEYSSAEERSANYKAQSLDELVRLRRAKRMQADVEEVYEYVNTKFRGLDNSRRDTDARVRMISLQTSLEK